MEGKGGSILHGKGTRAVEIGGKKPGRLDRGDRVRSPCLQSATMMACTKGDPPGRPYNLTGLGLQYISDQLFFQPPYSAALHAGFSCSDAMKG
jgi:hypothetical protein